tara:strand:- start:246 stop:728 length:483 start_codon:yes stop_codon:yes gene_type:complete
MLRSLNKKIPESVLVVIYDSKLNVLLLERADRAGFWQSVTGSKDFQNEKIRETAIREVKEETGLIVGGFEIPGENLYNWNETNIYEIFPEWRYKYNNDVSHNKEHVFGLLIPTQKEIRISKKEHLQYMWLPWNAAAEKCFSPSNKKAILDLPNKIKVVKI